MHIPSEIAELIKQPHEIRVDPIHGWSVIYAPIRASRPLNDAHTQLETPAIDAFAEGNESMTTPEVYAIRDAGTKPNEPGWKVRIIPNKYPVLVASTAGQNESTTGVHDVIIEHPKTESRFTNLTEDQIELVFQAYRDRIGMLSENPAIQVATLFKNEGLSAGASQPHVHSQLMGTTFVPPLLAQELEFITSQLNYFEAVIEQSIEQQRVVEQTDDFIVICPKVSRFGFEMQLFPKFDAPHYHELSDAECRQVGTMLVRSLKRIEAIIGPYHFNFCLKTAPFRHNSKFRWRFEIYPRIAGIAGWELGMGGFVNPIFPEVVAEKLRKSEII